MKRRRQSRRSSRRQFSKTAGREHKYNSTPPIMRGGLRL